uniref:Retrotransposable element Tf2 n=1 Tax=Cajanus cajan TaxID=3821 RepID=A0A151TRP9_CAJCA|nr:Retrotransposable element Tf2 [Cajanus cajan]
MKVEQIFACHQVSEERKVSLATLSFQHHAIKDLDISSGSSSHVCVDASTLLPLDKCICSYPHPLEQLSIDCILYWVTRLTNYIPDLQSSSRSSIVSLMIMVVHKTTKMSPFEIVYGFNPLTPLDLLPLPNVASFIHKEGSSRAEFIKKLHERVRDHIQSQTEKYTKYNNKGRKKVIKNKFPSKRKSKLSPREDGPFKVLKKINNNAYVLDLPQEYGVSPSFNISDLSLFTRVDDHEEASLDLRSNPLQKGGDDGGPWIKGPITRAMVKRMNEEWANTKEKPIVLFSWAVH